jgi:hypothetical protein
VAEQKAKQDKKNYQKVKKADGGYAFYDPDGKEISASDYANATGTKPSEVLADSENPIDIGYRDDYNNLQDYIHAKINSQRLTVNWQPKPSRLKKQSRMPTVLTWQR